MLYQNCDHVYVSDCCDTGIKDKYSWCMITFFSSHHAYFRMISLKYKKKLCKLWTCSKLNVYNVEQL